MQAALERHYALLDVLAPPVLVAPNLAVGFELAASASKDLGYDETRLEVRSAAFRRAQESDGNADEAFAVASKAVRADAFRVIRDHLCDRERSAPWNWAASPEVSAAWAAAMTNAGSSDPRVLRFGRVESALIPALESGLGWYFPLRESLIVVPRPRMRFREDWLVGPVLHAVDGPAVSWADGFGIDFVDGLPQ